MADGAWAFVKQAIPVSVKGADHKRIAEYVQAWAWKARRHGTDLFVALGSARRPLATCAMRLIRAP